MAKGASQTVEFHPTGWRCLEAHGPWPFVTRRVFEHADSRRHIWISRVHRKRLIQPIGPLEWSCLLRWFWAPGQLNWWIGTVFALGSLLFAAGCLLSLSPGLADLFGFRSQAINAVFFAGSIPFTSAAYLQLFQAANAPKAVIPEAAPSAQPRVGFGWRLNDVGWLSCALQFIGTILFNLNTFDATLPNLTWIEQDLRIWAPNIAGSVLFLISGYLAFIETCHAHWAWKVRELSWWVVFINLLGCVGFMMAAGFSFVPPGTPNESWAFLATVFTLQGALCFLIGSLLMLPEGVVDGRETRSASRH